MLFIPEFLIQIGFKGMLFLWDFAPFLPTTWLHLTLFRALNWRGEILVFQGKEKKPTSKIEKWKKRKAKFSLQSLNYIKYIETQSVAWLWIIFLKEKYLWNTEFILQNPCSNKHSFIKNDEGGFFETIFKCQNIFNNLTFCKILVSYA